MATGSLMTPFVLGAMDDEGNPLAGGKVWTYVAGSATELLSYQDIGLTIEHANPVVLNSAGRAAIYLQPTGYKIVLTDADDAVEWTQDNWLDVGQVQANETAFSVARSILFDLDNGSGVTIDDVLLRIVPAITISAARLIYGDATSGTVAAGTIQLGTTVGGVDIVAATPYQNAKPVGYSQTLTLVTTALAANTPLLARHTGVAATQAGKVSLQIEFS